MGNYLWEKGIRYLYLKQGYLRQIMNFEEVEITIGVTIYRPKNKL